jgi:group I intron endonuclease
MHYLYCITDTLNNKVYIGQSNKETERWRQHKYFSRQEKPIQYVHRAMAKYGVENFVYEVIATCKTPEDANETETQLIIQYDSRNSEKGYNIAPGGETPWNLGLPKDQNPLTGIPRSLEVRAKISSGNMGKIMPPASEHRKKFMSELYSGRILPREQVEKMAASHRGQKRSDEARRNISLAHIGVQAGENHPKAKLNWEKVRDIRRLYLEGTRPKELSQKYDVSLTNIYDILNHKIWKEK